MKYLMDDQTRAGLQVPNLKIYHDAMCLMWIREWLTLRNQNLLNLEGFNNR